MDTGILFVHLAFLFGVGPRNLVEPENESYIFLKGKYAQLVRKRLDGFVFFWEMYCVFLIARHTKKVLFMDPKSSTNRCQVMFQTPFFYPGLLSAWHPFRWIASRRGWFSLSGPSPFAPQKCFGEIYQGVPPVT